MKKYFFVCYANINRSRAAEMVSKNLAEDRGLNIESTSGAYCMLGQFNNNKLKDFLESFDEIFVMERYMEERFVEAGVPKLKIHCLNIPDNYDIRRDDEAHDLVSLLRLRLDDYF